MKLVISGNSSEDYFSQRDRISITRESKLTKIEWIELDSEKELEEWDEKHKILKEFSWEVRSFSSLETISETEEVSTKLESEVLTEVSTKIEEWKEAFEVSI